MSPRALAALLAVLLALAVAACGDDDDGGGGSGSTAAETQAETAPEEKTAEVSTNTEAKPEIGKPAGEPPAKLVTEDIVVGKGRSAKSGDELTVDYVGVTFTYGDQIDASWDAGKPFTFTLGEGNVIKGWDQGIAGMKVGGRRKLTIPSDLAYGPEGQPPAIPPDEPLVFVVDLRKIG